MWFLQKKLFVIFIFSLFSELQAHLSIVSDTSLLCLFKENPLENCNSSLDGYNVKFKLFNIANFTIDEIIKLPTDLIYILPLNKLEELSGVHLASLLVVHQDYKPIAKKILQSVLTDQQRTEFLNFLVSRVITNDEVLDLIGETVYKWNYDAKDGKFQKLSNICGYTLARLWAPYVLTRTKSTSKRLLTLLTELEQKQNDGLFCNKQVNWKNLPKVVRRKWSYLIVSQSYPSPLTNWTVKQIAQYKFLLPDFNNDELRLIPFDELSQMALHDIDFDNSQARFLFSLLMGNSTLKDVKILYPKLFFKLSPLQVNQFDPEEWADEKAAISSLENIYYSYTVAKQIFNKIANNWFASKTKPINGWTSEDLRHLPLLYTQPATTFLKFCTTPPSVQSFVSIASHMLTDRQVFYLSGCGSMLSFHKRDPKLLLGLKYIINAVPVASILSINTGNINYQLESYLVSLVSDRNLPIALHLLNITNPVKNNYFIEDMLKNKNNILFEQFAPSDMSTGSLFYAFKQLYSNYSDRIDRLPKHMLNIILESNELSIKWTDKESVIIKGLYNGYTCNFIRKLNSAQFIISISNYNMYLKQNGKVFPKNLQICVAEAFINYLKLKSKFTPDLSPTWIYLEAWEIESIQGFVLTTFPIDIILNSILRDNILYAIGRLSFPELMIATQPKKLSLMVDQYITHILKNESSLSYGHLYNLGNLIHFIPTKYLYLVDEQAFKFLIETDLFDTRICVDSFSKRKWAELIIRAFGNPKNWSSDVLVTLSDLLIVLNKDQLNSIPKMSRLNSADIIRTRYIEEIEWFFNNIPFYKGCKLFLDNQYENFTDSLSTLIDFHLVSMQSQLQLISPIIYNYQYEEIMKSPMIPQPKIFKPTVLIPIPEFDNVLKSPNNLFKQFFSGKEIQDIDILNTTKNIQATTTSVLEESINIFTSENDHTENTFGDITLTKVTNNNYTKISNITYIKNLEYVKNNNYHVKQLTNENTNVTDVLNLNASSSSPNIIEKIGHNEDKFPLDFINEKHLHNIKYHAYNVTSDSSLFEFVEIPIMGYNINENHSNRKERMFEPIFNSSVQIGCEALKMLGPASVTSIQFNLIIYSMNDEELENCVDLLGSFDINPELARYIWSKTKDKAALHTYGSVLSALSFDDLKTIDLDINRPWSLELIYLLSKYVKTDNMRKEILKQFIRKSKSNMPSHLWGSIGSLICQLQPRTFKMIMPNKELFWRMSSAFNTINTCDIPCIQNLALVAVSVIGESSLWKTAEVEQMGIMLSGINMTQWNLLLNYNPEALEGLSTNTIKCLGEQQIKAMNETHLKYLTPKSAHTLLESHSKLLEFQSKEMLSKLVNFELKIDWQPVPVVIQNTIEGHKYIRPINSKTDIVYAFVKNNMFSNEMPAVSKTTKNHILSFSSILSAAIILLYWFLNNTVYYI